jgi:uncharacterized RDD family membrane protein YckC
VTEPGSTQYAGAVSRTAAFVTDALLVAVVAAGGLVVVLLVSAAVSTAADDLSRTAVPLVAALLPLGLALYNWLFWALAGRTPGMALLGLRVVAVDGRAASSFAALVRAVVLAGLPIGALWVLVDRRGQGLHDKLARTTVVCEVNAGRAEAAQGDRANRAVAPVRQRWSASS